MTLQDGDYVTTGTGLYGRIVHVSRQSAFVELELVGGKEIVPFLLSELIRVDPPHDEPKTP
jgi:preprotein translocase subunit YajC